MLISCVFFIITIAVYAWVPELQNLHGCVLMVYLACLCVGFAFLSTAQIMKTANNVTANVCLGFTILIYFALLSAFFWLNVMCFDIWWTFSGKRGLSLENRSVRMRFCAYAAYAFGFPTALTVLLAALEFNDLSEYLVMPMVREQGCYFYETCRIYLYGPFVILCIANLVFFILTAWKINQIKKQTQKTLKSENSCITDQQRTDRQRFLLYVKLFTIMGINWILEIFSALYPQADNVWRFTDAYNTMTGFYIFVIFVCKKKILCLIKKRYHQLRGHSMSGTQTTSTKTLSSARDHGSQGMGMEPVKNNTQV
ncbi:G-protein coupled receptor Mth2-like [Choristoneura fumiferana]|uniref:G-protein coupled receptor Mth2-like n=1 Tax=Choristoneura fumiferana TaxID=7141 RepID=UPI003D15CAAC